MKTSRSAPRKTRNTWHNNRKEDEPPVELTEELLLDELFPAEDDLIKETCPLPPEETAKEYELYLADIGVRI